MRPALAWVERWLGASHPETALVLGSGMGDIATRMREVRRLSYDEVPGFPTSQVAGHHGELVVGMLGERLVLCQSGRFHGYEGHAADVVALPVRLFAALGIRRVILTNAAGGIASRLVPGSLMLITDQINLTFRNPLHGPVLSGETRFPDLSAPFDLGLLTVATTAALRAGIRLEQGVYVGVSGPSYETPAEIRMLRTLGADAVGMSTVLEVVAAQALRLPCLGISVVTNRASGLGGGSLSHEEVLAVSAAAGRELERLLIAIVDQIG